MWGGGKLSELDGSGTCQVKTRPEGYRTTCVKVVIAESATERAARIDTELKDAGSHDDEDRR